MKPFDPSAVTALIDSREQRPYVLHPLQSVTATLQSGDYSIRGLERDLAVERKSVDDLVQCIGPERERFLRELERLQAYSHCCVVVEGDWQQLTEGQYRSRLNPKSAANSVTSWMSKYGVPFAFVGNREAGESFTRNFLFLTARAEWQRLQDLQQAMDGQGGEK